MKTSLLRLSLILAALLALLYGLAQPEPAAARGSQQQIYFQTSTPNADGRILYTVKENDSCNSLALLAGVTVDQILEWNNLTGECVLVANTQILLGQTTPQAMVTPSPGPSVTPTPLLPTPTAEPGKGDICVLVYLDENGDGVRTTNEIPIPGSQISLTNRSGSVSETETNNLAIDPDTEDYAPTCFSNLLEGEYTLSAAMPAGYNPTTELNYTIEIKAGDVVRINFGGQPSLASSSGSTTDTPKTPWMGLVGGIALLLGIGLGVYSKFFRKG